MFNSNIRTSDRASRELNEELTRKTLDSQIDDLHDAATRTTSSQSRLDALASLVGVDSEGNITIDED